jgi:small subunit ribosomal protein S1
VVTSQETQNSKEPTMAELLETAELPGAYNYGDVVEGEIMRVDQDGILLSIGHKSEGIIPPSEMRSAGRDAMDQYHVGDTLLAYIVEPSTDEGHVVLSLDRARGEAAWRRLEECAESGETIEAEITGFNRGGAVVDIEGLQGFVPLSHLAPSRQGQGGEVDLEQRVGERVTLKVLELNRRRRRVILSERSAMRERREERKEQLLNSLQEGDVVKGRITGISSFGAFVDLGGADGLIHISEIAWTPVENVEEVLHVGQEVEVQVLRVERESRRIGLSLRQLQPAPWDLIAERYVQGQMVTGTVTKLTGFGAFARVDDAVEGLIHISELTDRSIHHPKEVVQVGDTLNLRIVTIDPARRRLGLSLKQAEDEPEPEASGL